MQFTQHIVIDVPDEAALERLLQEWRVAGPNEGAGFLGGRLLRFRDQPGRYLLQADFDSWKSAETNNAREETQQWRAKLDELIEGEATFENLDVLRNF
jgi:quinol monooxygenase YgiN